MWFLMETTFRCVLLHFFLINACTDFIIINHMGRMYRNTKRRKKSCRIHRWKQVGWKGGKRNKNNYTVNENFKV